MVDTCQCCAPPWTFQQSPMAVAVLGQITGVKTLSVYNAYDGSLRWAINVERRNAGSSVTVNSVCFGLNQSVYVTQREIHTTPSAFSNYYVHQYDKSGNFVAETVLSSYNDLAPAGQIIASNQAGQVVVNDFTLTPRVYGRVIGGADLISPVNNLVLDMIDVDDSGYVYAVDGTWNIYRWDSSGTYIQTLTNPLAAVPRAMAVEPDGTYLWIASSVLSFGNYTNTFKKVSIPGNSVLATNTTVTATQLSSISVSPWGTRYEAFANTHVATDSQGGLQIKISGSTLTRNLPGKSPTTVSLSVSPGSPLYGTAVSID